MANVEHSAITDPNIHEPKGVATADEFTVYISDGAGSGDWGLITEDSLDVTVADSFSSNLLHVVYKTDTPSDQPTVSTWTQRKLNTIVTNEISASLSSNRITLSAGTYYIEADVLNFFDDDGAFQAKLYNVTDSSDILFGTVYYNPSPTSDELLGISTITGRFTLSGSKQIELRTYQNNTDSKNLPTLTTWVPSGNIIYHNVRIWKVA